MQAIVTISTIEICTAALVARTLTIPLDNELIGEPELECDPVSIAISFATLNTFEGHVYVKGRFDEPGCRSDGTDRGVAGISMPFSTCGVLRERSLNPQGLFASATVIITFHPYFLTKMDRVFKVKCFYMEADKTISSPLFVSDMATLFATHTVPMPICRYEILEGGPDGKPATYALVGMQAYHQWVCDSETSETFCMRVHSCYVEDGRNQSVEYLDSSGCAVDVHILSNIEYNDNLHAGQQFYVYKFADRSQLLFKCQITISIKESGIECSRPACALQQRYRRNIDGIGSVDVSHTLESLDIDKITSIETSPLHRYAFCIISSDMDTPLILLAFLSMIFMVIIIIRIRSR